MKRFLWLGGGVGKLLFKSCLISEHLCSSLLLPELFSMLVSSKGGFVKVTPDTTANSLYLFELTNVEQPPLAN